jgi:O-antigen/teichoic acid export membrane protein
VRPVHAVRAVQRVAVVALGIGASTSVFTAILILYLVRALGPKGFGTFSLALSIGGITLLLSDFSISHSAARFVAESRRDRGAIATIAATALGMKVATGTVASLALFLLASPIAQAYGHAILPLCNERDKRTQVRWGLADFERLASRDDRRFTLG